ncbi:MAG: tRNA pseudouridine(55) synthase TruB [Kiritimatiellaeota bacterium]|nr:tRNA pseudouridine(55) synthase TruB [Kiritimatiellota bacterium]
MGRGDKHRLPAFEHNGILLVDKPSEWTSHDVVHFVRRRFNVKKVGHAGTLDPAATGLLVLLLGKATKMSQTLSQSDKTYSGEMLFGVETDSQDMDGKVISEKDASFLTEELVLEVFDSFIGPQLQTPPMVSAVKVGGKKLYELAREGKEVEREPRDMEIYSLVADEFHLPVVNFTVECTKGTYVRTICSDIGAKLGCGGVLKSLRRLRSGEYNVANTHDIEEMREKWTQDDLLRALVSF